MARNGFTIEQDQNMALGTDDLVRLTLVETIEEGMNAFPPGVYADSISVASFKGSGTGEFRLARDHVFPTSAYLELNAASELKVEQAGQSDEIASKAKLVIRAKSN